MSHDKPPLENKHLKSSPGDGWEFCTNTDRMSRGLCWAREEYGDDYRYKVVGKAYDDGGNLMKGRVSIWRKKK